MATTPKRHRSHFTWSWNRLVIKDINEPHYARYCPYYTRWDGNGHGPGCPQHTPVL